MKKINGYVPLLIIFFVSVVYVAINSPELSKLRTPSDSQAAGETKKEISRDAPPFISGLGTFTDIPLSEYLSVGSDYWVRLTVSGKENAPAPYSGSDVMLVLDMTGSMREPMAIGPSAPNVNTTRMQAAKQALRSFTNDAKVEDYIGFATFTYCIPSASQYTATANGVPLSWAYENTSSTNVRAGLGFLHQPLRQASPAHLQSINNLLSDVNTTGTLRLSGNNAIYCTNNTHTGSQTNPGGGLVTGLSQLTNIIQNQSRPDNTLFRSSYASSFPGPGYRPDKKRYIVMATDGEENIFPRAYETQSLIQQLNSPGVQNAVQYAARNGVIIYTLSIGNEGNSFAANLQSIATDTGGKYFPGRNRDELINSYQQISNEVESNATQLSMTIHEEINTNYFNIPDLDPTTGAYANRFYVSKAVNGGDEQNVTNSVCAGGTCITKLANSNYDFELPAIAGNEKYFIYFKVQAINSTTTPQNVDSAASKVIYSDNSQISMANKQVLINQPKPFFQATTGDVYSKGTIRSPLILNESLVLKNESIVFYNNNIDLGLGQANPINRKTPYSMPNQAFYDYYETILENQIQTRNVAGGNIQRSHLATTNSSLGLSITKLTSSTREFTFNNAGDFNDDVTRIIFIDGDLYIRNGGYSVSRNGLNSLVFIVSGNLAFDKSISKAEGIFFVDGAVDTVCDASARFVAGECAPNTIDLPLDIQGAVIVGNAGQIKLQRFGNPTENQATRKPGELFTYRPDMIWALNEVLGKVIRSWKEVTD